MNTKNTQQKYPASLRDYTVISDGKRYWEDTNGFIPQYLNASYIDKFGKKAAAMIGYIHNCLSSESYDGIKYKDDKGIEYVEKTRSGLAQTIGCTSHSMFTTINLLENSKLLNVVCIESSHRKHVSYFLISLNYEKLEDICNNAILELHQTIGIGEMI